MSRMDYYSNELEDDFIEIDDTISSEEYHFSEVKEKKKEDKIPFYNDWKKQRVRPASLSALQRQRYQAIGNAIDAKLRNEDTISNEEYHSSEVKEKKKKDSSYDWTHSATVVSPAYYNSQWLPNQLNCANTQQCILDAQQYNGYQNLANACQTQQFIANPTDFIQQQLNTSCNNVENGLRNVFDAISKIMEN